MIFGKDRYLTEAQFDHFGSDVAIMATPGNWSALAADCNLTRNFGMCFESGLLGRGVF
jgi:hypothetical protein